ncbi:MAG: glycosyltransferase family 2 protein [Lachnospiraceae bacterium]|nr:glycosyltransferase family 2 protein [Lachnospiraceae bacterium]
MEKVSVIIPTYNRASTLLRAVNSVLQQSYSDIEVIIVDDGSTDNTAEIIRDIRDERVKYIKMEQNGGASVARNEGVKVAEGDIIAFQDSDDAWKRDKLEKQICYLKAHPEFSMVYCAYNMHGRESSYIVPTELALEGDLEGDIFPWLLMRNSVGTPTMVMYKECFADIGGFDSTLKALEDWDMAIRFAEKYMIGFVDEALMDVYCSEGRISTRTGAYYESRCKMIAKYRAYFIHYGIFDDVVNRLFQQAQDANMLEAVKKMLMLYLSQG